MQLDLFSKDRNDSYDMSHDAITVTWFLVKELDKHSVAEDLWSVVRLIEDDVRWHTFPSNAHTRFTQTLRAVASIIRDDSFLSKLAWDETHVFFKHFQDLLWEIVGYVFENESKFSCVEGWALTDVMADVIAYSYRFTSSKGQDC